jgi:hypothetical protein
MAADRGERPLGDADAGPQALDVRRDDPLEPPRLAGLCHERGWRGLQTERLPTGSMGTTPEAASDERLHSLLFPKTYFWMATPGHLHLRSRYVHRDMARIAR